MSESRLTDGEQPIDLTAVGRDELLLDALARGDDAPAGDAVASMLAAWRAELHADEVAAEVEAERVRTVVPVNGEPGPTRATARAPGRSRVGRRILRAAAAVVALAGLSAGLVLGSEHAGPTSPLWSLTKVIHPQQAEVRSVEYTIERARAAISTGQVDEARQLIDEARTQLPKVTDTATVTRLRAELDALLRDLSTVSPRPSTPPASTPTQVAVPGGGPAVTRDPATKGASPAPESPPDRSATPRTIPLPPLPTLPPAPIPSVLQSPLPGLSLPI